MIPKLRTAFFVFVAAHLFFGVLTITKVGFAQTEEQAFFITISVNEVKNTNLFPAFSEGEDFFLPVQAFDFLGILLPDTPPVLFQGQGYFPLSKVQGLTFEFQQGQLNLKINCLPSCYPSSTLSRIYDPPIPDPSPLGLFLNYDVMAEKAGAKEVLGSMAELGVFSNYGSGNLTFSGRAFDNTTKFTRLESNWTIDYLEKRTRLRFGDTISHNGGWGRSVRFGGVQYGTDFGLQPGFISFPTPTIMGSASLPSTAEIYVNGIRRASVDLEPGAFTIEQPPIITGAGNLQVVITDLLGRETILNQPFYATRSLLKQDLVEYSVEAGFLRNNFGMKSNDYNEAFVSGTYRKGINQNLTLGIHGEASTKRAGVGPYVDWYTPLGGVLSSAVALSVKDGKVGELFQINFGWESDTVGVSFSNEWISTDYTRLGTQLNFSEPKMRTSANIGFDVFDNNSLSINYTRVEDRTYDTLQIASANYSLPVGDSGAFSFNVSRSFGEFKDTSLFFVFTTRLGERSTGSATVDHSGGKWKGSLRASRNAPSEGGFGVRGEVSAMGVNREQAGVTYISDKGVATLDHSQFKGKGTTRLGLRGGIVLMEGKPYLTKPINDSFALVKVGGFEGVGVFRDNRLVTRTNGSGEALISHLRAYEKNKISINPLDLPMSAEIKAIHLNPVPKRRSGVIVDFPVQQTVAASFKIVDDEGKPLLAGTILYVEGVTTGFPVGFGGEAYVTGLDKPRVLWADTAKGRCTIRLEEMEPSAFPKRLGTIVCVGENP